MVVLAVAYAIQCINDVYIKSPSEDWLALTPLVLTKGYVWQLLTFQFLHVNLWHLVCNLITLWFLGRFVENVLGTWRFLIAYFGSGIIGGLLQSTLMYLFPEHFFPYACGASAGISGVFAIFCLLQTNSEIQWSFVFPIRADILLWITAAISLFFTLVPTPREWGIAHAAHLGGILTGLLWVKLGWHHDYIRLPWENLFARRQKREMAATRAGTGWFRSSATNKPDADLSTDEFLKTEVDPILEKISAHGIQSLTANERKILEKARSKMERR
jgi:membrane associated rhomboid family serine protease